MKKILLLIKKNYLFFSYKEDHEKNIELLIENCIDSAIVGNYLTTTGFSPDNDKEKVKKAGKILKH